MKDWRGHQGQLNPVSPVRIYKTKVEQNVKRPVLHKGMNTFFLRTKAWMDLALAEATKERVERVMLTVAIVSFCIHLLFILLIQLGWIHLADEAHLFSNPIAAIYTPFSFILVYEVYLLIYYLPKSITTYIAKQYEIITLIIIRRLFKDLSVLKLSDNWFHINDDLQFTYDLVASVVLFYLLYLFVKIGRKPATSVTTLPGYTDRFIYLKKIMAVLLVPVLFAVALFSFSEWALGIVQTSPLPAVSFKNINNIFFDQFFTILIIVDVLLLLFSFFYTDQFHKVIRNSGFIISTILIRISFQVKGLTNTALIVVAVLFGLLILVVHNLYEKNERTRDETV